METTITTQEYKDRIVKLLGRGLAGVPKSPRDQQILLKSAALKLDPQAKMSEQDINAELAQWAKTFGAGEVYDHVTLRRALIDYGYLRRSSDGASYQVSASGPANWSFEAGIENVDVPELLEAARQEMEARKRAYMEKEKQKKG